MDSRNTIGQLSVIRSVYGQVVETNVRRWMPSCQCQHPAKHRWPPFIGVRQYRLSSLRHPEANRKTPRQHRETRHQRTAPRFDGLTRLAIQLQDSAPYTRTGNDATQHRYRNLSRASLAAVRVRVVVGNNSASLALFTVANNYSCESSEVQSISKHPASHTAHLS